MSFARPLAGAIGDAGQVRGPARFSDLFSEAMIFPLGVSDPAQADERIREGFQRFFEETWLHRPLKALGGVPPIDAAGHGILKKKLRGIADFLEQCAALNQFSYDFDRLRRKLGLAASQVQAGGESAPAVDIPALAAPELAGLKIEDLADQQLEQAYQTALKLDARELASHFAKALVTRPALADRPDRFAWFNHLILLGQAAGNWDEALEYVDQGEKDDCEHNEGRRRNDYELRAPRSWPSAATSTRRRTRSTVSSPACRRNCVTRAAPPRRCSPPVAPRKPWITPKKAWPAPASKTTATWKDISRSWQRRRERVPRSGATSERLVTACQGFSHVR